jgi:isoleucyl-tRNA synthetase
MVNEVEKGSLTIMMGGFPDGDLQVEDNDLIFKTKQVRDIIAIGQRLRNENQLKIKQPLKTMYLNVDERTQKAVYDYENVIKDELNIKNIVFEQDNTKFNDAYLQVNFKQAGSVLKGDVQKVRNTLLELSQDDMNKLVEMYNNGSVSICGYENLSSELFVLCYKAKPDYVMATENNLTVVLDTTLDENLMLEGLSRELIRTIQVLRKESGFNIEQRIMLNIQSQDETINKVIETYKDKIISEVLVNTFGEIENPTTVNTVEIGGEQVTISLKA